MEGHGAGLNNWTRTSSEIFISSRNETGSRVMGLEQGKVRAMRGNDVEVEGRNRPALQHSL
jgi:hypothetical protein